MERTQRHEVCTARRSGRYEPTISTMSLALRTRSTVSCENKPAIKKRTRREYDVLSSLRTRN
jgi:hypothetical protein